MELYEYLVLFMKVKKRLTNIENVYLELHAFILDGALN